MPQDHNSNSLRFLNIRTTILYLFAVIAILVVAFPWLYEIKSSFSLSINSESIAIAYDLFGQQMYSVTPSAPTLSNIMSG